MTESTLYKLLEACREQGCPVCRLEQQSVERYLDNQFYENVNSPKWRDHLRASLGFCHEHAWLAVNKRLGDALGFSILYHDIVNSVLNQLSDDARSPRTPGGWMALLGQVPETARHLLEKMVSAFTPRKRCPVCEHRDEATRNTIVAFVEGLETPEMVSALQDSDGLCLPHLRMTLEYARSMATCETLLNVHREKLEALKGELSEFIRKNDYQFSAEGFGEEGNAWLRAIGLVVGTRP